MIRSLNLSREISLYLDIHAHSRKGNVFMYGVEEKNRPKPTVRLFPALLDKNPFSDALFSFKDCTFNVGKGRESTARVVVARELLVKHSYTVESSYCGPDEGPLACTQFSTKHLEMVGIGMADTILQIYHPDAPKRKFSSMELSEISLRIRGDKRAKRQLARSIERKKIAAQERAANWAVADCKRLKDKKMGRKSSAIRTIEDWGSDVVDGYSAILQDGVHLKRSDGTIAAGWYYTLGCGIGAYDSHDKRRSSSINENYEKHLVDDNTGCSKNDNNDGGLHKKSNHDTKKERKKMMMTHDPKEEELNSKSGFTGRSGKGAVNHRKMMTSNLSGKTINGPTSFVLSVSSKSRTEVRNGSQMLQISPRLSSAPTESFSAPSSARSNTSPLRGAFHYGFLSKQVAFAEEEYNHRKTDSKDDSKSNNDNDDEILRNNSSKHFRRSKRNSRRLKNKEYDSIKAGKEIQQQPFRPVDTKRQAVPNSLFQFRATLNYSQLKDTSTSPDNHKLQYAETLSPSLSQRPFASGNMAASRISGGTTGGTTGTTGFTSKHARRNTLQHVEKFGFDGGSNSDSPHRFTGRFQSSSNSTSTNTSTRKKDSGTQNETFDGGIIDDASNLEKAAKAATLVSKRGPRAITGPLNPKLLYSSMPPRARRAIERRLNNLLTKSNETSSSKSNAQKISSSSGTRSIDKNAIRSSNNGHSNSNTTGGIVTGAPVVRKGSNTKKNKNSSRSSAATAVADATAEVEKSLIQGSTIGNGSSGSNDNSVGSKITSTTSTGNDEKIKKKSGKKGKHRSRGRRYRGKNRKSKSKSKSNDADADDHVTSTVTKVLIRSRNASNDPAKTKLADRMIEKVQQPATTSMLFDALSNLTEPAENQTPPLLNLDKLKLFQSGGSVSSRAISDFIASQPPPQPLPSGNSVDNTNNTITLINNTRQHTTTNNIHKNMLSAVMQRPTLAMNNYSREHLSSHRSPHSPHHQLRRGSNSPRASNPVTTNGVGDEMLMGKAHNMTRPYSSSGISTETTTTYINTKIDTSNRRFDAVAQAAAAASQRRRRAQDKNYLRGGGGTGGVRRTSNGGSLMGRETSKRVRSGPTAMCSGRFLPILSSDGAAHLDTESRWDLAFSPINKGSTVQ
jgi:hypothetical protein